MRGEYNGYNAKVRAELGGEEAAHARVEEYPQFWPNKLVAHCDAVRKRPMPDSTFEAFAKVLEWRSGREVPEYALAVLAPKRRGFPVRGEGKEYRRRVKARIESRAFRRLARAHPDEYHAIYEEERRREAAQQQGEQ